MDWLFEEISSEESTLLESTVKAVFRAAEVVDVERGPNREKRAGYLTFQVGG